MLSGYHFIGAQVVPGTIVVVGGGVSGLSVTFHLKGLMGHRPDPATVICLEAAQRPGGNICTSKEEGFVCEWGPNGFLDNEPATLDLVRALGIEDRLLPSNETAKKRFVFRGGRLHRLPSGPLSFLRSDLLSLRGRLRLLAEPLAPARHDDGDESVLDFASRRIGPEAASILVDAMVSGIWAGDVRKLSLDAAFPKMSRMEAEHGSLFRAMLSRRRRARASRAPSGGPAGPGGRLTSFKGGMNELIDALAAAIEPGLRLGVQVTRITRSGERGFRVHLSEGGPMDASVVVLACPAWSAATVVSSMDPEMSGSMKAIEPSPIAVVHLGYDPDDMVERPEGFGFLVPRGQGPRILGSLWTSSIFQGRAASGRILLTCMIGGAHDREITALSDPDLIAITREDLRTVMGITSTPRFVRVFRHRRGIPQYNLGHLDRVRLIKNRLDEHPGLLVCGNSYRGVSVNACAAEAPGIAEAALALAEGGS